MSTFVFADIGKKSRDLLSKDFVVLDDKKKFNRTAIEVKTKSLSGTGFIFSATRKADDVGPETSFEGKVQVKRACKEYHLEYDATISTDSIKVNATHELSAVDGLKVGVTGDFLVPHEEHEQGKIQRVGGSFSADYKKSGNAVNFKVTSDREKKKKSVDVSAAHTHNNTVVGAIASFVVEESSKGPSKAGISAQHHGLDSQVSFAILAKLPKEKKAEASKDAEATDATDAAPATTPAAVADPGRDISATFNIFHEYSASSQFAVEATVPLRKIDTEASLKVGLVHKLADDETVRARFEIGGSNSQRLGLSYSTRFGAHTSITASTDLAIQQILSSGLSDNAARVGINVSLNAE